MIGMAATVMLMWWIGNRIWTRRRVEATVTVNGAVRDALANRENGNSADHEANVSVVGSGTDNDFYKQCIQGRTHPQERERRPKVVDVGMNHDNRSVTTSATAFASIVADDDDAVPLVDAQPYSPHTPVVTFQNAQ